MSNSLAISSQLTFVRLRGIMGHFHEASARYNVPVSLLLAVASRESNMGLALDKDYTGDHGFGMGIMQIDKRYHADFTNAYANNDHGANIDYGSRFLAGLIGRFNGELLPAIAAYNSGFTRVRNAINAGIHPDLVTTGRDYASDVLQRKQLIESTLGISKAQSASVVLLPTLMVAFATYSILNHKS